jgi:hypothetical protein
VVVVRRALVIPAVTLLLFQKPRKLLNWQNKRERLPGFNSQSLEPVDLLQRAPTETLALVAMEVLSLMTRPLLVVDLVAAQLMAVVRAWQLVAVAVDRAVAVVTSSSHRLRPRAIPVLVPVLAQALETTEVNLIFNVAGVRDMEGHRPETLKVIGDNLITISSPPRMLRHRIWAIST